MGIFDEISSMAGGLLGGGAASPVQALLGSVMGLHTGEGLQQLIAQFEQAGLGHIVQSWISPGQTNQPVSPEQLHSVLGPEQVQGMASQAGMQPGDFLSHLAQLLPHAVDHATPEGRLPA